MKKRMRLSGQDIRFINELRGSEEPVYEVVNGQPTYRPTLTGEEIKALEKDRQNRFDSLNEGLKTVIDYQAEMNPEYELDEFEVTIQFKHKKKRYSVVHKLT